MPLDAHTHGLQAKFVNFCRSSRAEEVPGLAKDRAEIYRGLVVNIVKDALERAYPITRVKLGETKWQALTEDFFSAWPCENPELWRMPKNLCEYVRTSACTEKLSCSYLSDLLEFEWQEIEVYMMPDGEVPNFAATGDPKKDALIINPDFKIIHLDYPVYDGSADWEKPLANPQALLIFRHRQDFSVRFVLLSELWRQLITELANSPAPQNLAQALSFSCNKLNLPTTIELYEEALGFVQALIKDGMVLGYHIRRLGDYETAG